ncbi:sulfotransferase domain-containing protein [Nitrosopumilus sp.]|jgi:hypothetical protein|nr:sulfotransferase domain-containing protein [Nitrosopumilus sp.]
MNLRKIYQKIYYQFFKRHYYGITAKSRVLPDFLIIGSVRSGTTSLYYDICQHPSIEKAAYDEIGYFDDNYHLGENWYRSFFPTKNKMQKIKQNTRKAITGEDTPFYIWNEIASKRIKKDLPGVKLIVILRNPVERAYSNYFLGVREGNEINNFDQAIKEDIKLIENKTPEKLENYDYKRSYIAKGFYAKQLKKWLKNFQKDQIYIISTEELEKNPKVVLNNIFQFLKLSDFSINQINQYKKSKYPEINYDIKKKLNDYFEPHNEELFKLINKKFDW